MTIYDIKERTKETSPYFFSKNTLGFFGQTMGDFKVYKQDDKYLITAPHYKNGELRGHTERLFNPKTNELEMIK